MTNQPESMFEQLQRTFLDTLNKGTSLSAIVVQYRDAGNIRIEIGVPYSLKQDTIEIGPYAKDPSFPIPYDFNERKKQIPLDEIISFKRRALLD